jgi:hypothetical protein
MRLQGLLCARFCSNGRWNALAAVCATVRTTFCATFGAIFRATLARRCSHVAKRIVTVRVMHDDAVSLHYAQRILHVVRALRPSLRNVARKAGNAACKQMCGRSFVRMRASQVAWPTRPYALA